MKEEGRTVRRKVHVNYAETRYGFEYGAAKVKRLFSCDRTGAVWIGVSSDKGEIQIRVTRTGRISAGGFTPYDKKGMRKATG